MDPKASNVHSKANKASLKRAMESIKGLSRDLEKELEIAHNAEQVTPSQKALSAFLKGMYNRLPLIMHLRQLSYQITAGYCHV